MVAANQPFWRAALAGRSWAQLETWRFAVALMLALTAFYLAAVIMVSNRHTVRPLLAVLLVIGAAVSYYVERYAIYFDGAMLSNVMATNYGEARELLGWGMAAHLLVWGFLPAALLWWPRLLRRPLGRALALRLAWVLGSLGIGVLSLLLIFADFASLMRNHREMRHLITPGNVVAASIGNAWGSANRPAGPKLVVAPDAKLAAAWQGRIRPALFVLVVGETARSRNFGLNGYERQTTPELAKRGAVSFADVSACGTSTEVSLPCMFSSFGRRNYDETKILSHESVLQVLARAGFQVIWRDNQSGCKGVCDGLRTDQLDRAGVQSLCPEGQCFDEILLHGMEGIVRDAKGNLFVVMHQLGSHGPAYFKRYPAAFKRFSPACQHEDLRMCSADEIRNAYDNSLLYTDFVVSRVIDFLEGAQKTHDTALLYVSDHGESLGEGGLYLHGMPYAIAPDVQKKVPLVMWLSPAFQRGFGVSQSCLRGRSAQPLSHDHLFHSLLGILDVQTSAYETGMDLFAPCRSPAMATLKSAQSAR